MITSEPGFYVGKDGKLYPLPQERKKLWSLGAVVDWVLSFSDLIGPNNYIYRHWTYPPDWSYPEGTQLMTAISTMEDEIYVVTAMVIPPVPKGLEGFSHLPPEMEQVLFSGVRWAIPRAKIPQIYVIEKPDTTE